LETYAATKGRRSAIYPNSVMSGEAHARWPMAQMVTVDLDRTTESPAKWLECLNS
jgi:hypothetical protein